MNFNLGALFFCTINDFPAYGNMSGDSVKGQYACPICEENTSYHKLNMGGRLVTLATKGF